MHTTFKATLLLCLAATAWAQNTSTTSLVGTVTDTGGGAVVGAKVTAVNKGTQDTYNTTTNEQGNYRIEFIRVGTYNLTIEQAGFQRFEKRDILVETNRVVRNDAQLSVGSVSESITVEATASVIRTDDASVSEIISTREIADLPLNGRDAMKLATTTPGVIQGLKDPNGVPPGQGFIGAGTREIQNSMSLDGISIMNNLITTTPTRPMVESVQEVEVQTGTYSAQYGAYMGVHINMITKSGTNSLHGNLVEFVRNDAFDARPYFLNPRLRKTVLRQNQFGFELDGPVVIPKLYNGRDKTFFMVSYEGLRQRREGTSVANIMTPEMFRGDFSAVPTAIIDPTTGSPFPGNIIPPNRISPVVTKLQQYFPTPNLAGLSQNLSVTNPNSNDTDQTVNRIDQNIGSTVRLSYRYQRQTGTILNGNAIPVNGVTSPLLTNNHTISYTHTITPTLVSDVRVGRNYFDSQTVNPFYSQGITDAGTQLGIPGFDADSRFGNPGIPDFNIAGFSGLNAAGTNWFQDDKTWQGSAQISWTRGAHTIMAGAEFRKLITGREAGNSPRGTFTFNNSYTGYAPASFVLGIPQTLITPLRQVRGVVAEWRDGFFVLDNWQATRKLTLNYGIRYELPTVPYSVNGYHTLLNAEQTAVRPENPPQPGLKFIAPNHNNWAPRFGFAYRLTNKTVVRGGFGIYYNPNQTNSFTFLNGNPPFGLSTTYTSDPARPTLSLSNPTPSDAQNPTPIPNFITDAWHLPTAYMNQWSFGIARELWKNAGFETQYLGSHSLHLDRSYYNNTPLPGPGPVNSRRPNRLFGQIRTIQNDLIANYQGLSLIFRQRFTRGLQMQANYTWSHTLDVSSDSNNSGAPMDPYDWRRDYGNSNWDIRHRFVATYVYDIPLFSGASRWVRAAFGSWQINGITTLQSGRSFNVSISEDRANTAPGSVQRPDLVGTPSSNCNGSHLTACIDASAFRLPALYTYGTAGRNIFRGPHLYTTDLSLFKNIPFSERVRFQFRIEAFNAFNSPMFSNPASNFSNLATFGNITSTSIDNRVMQLGGKLVF